MSNVLTITQALDVENTISQFRQLLSTPQHAYVGSEPHELTLAGLVLVPESDYPSGPLETVPTEVWSDELNTNVVKTTAVTKAFLSTLHQYQSRVLILTPSIVSSMQLPFRSVESTMVSALHGFAATLRNEAATIGVDVCELRLGHFDTDPPSSPRSALTSDAGQEVLTWPSSTRSAYGQNYLASRDVFHSKQQKLLHGLGHNRRDRGSNLRELNNAVFDTLTCSRPWGVQRVGQGSFAYEVIGLVTPATIVRRLMGMKPVEPAPSARRVSDSGSWETVNHDH
ncbi:MAG: hypothetical protein Q9162_000794 [Coniocarpon cinnabarinum]